VSRSDGKSERGGYRGLSIVVVCACKLFVMSSGEDQSGLTIDGQEVSSASESAHDQPMVPPSIQGHDERLTFPPRSHLHHVPKPS
jgi:hypothetical protein